MQIFLGGGGGDDVAVKVIPYYTLSHDLHI